MQLRVLVELVQHNLRLRAALQADHHPHAVAVALVARAVGADVDFGDDLVLHQLGNALEERRLVHLVRNLGDNQRLLFLGHVLYGYARAHQEAAAARTVRFRDSRAP